MEVGYGRCAINLILITTGGRPDLLLQSLESLKEHSVDFKKHTLTVVFDGPSGLLSKLHMRGDSDSSFDTTIINYDPQGASASRNIGAGSIPKYRRQEHVMFLDDDVYACPGWDELLENLARSLPKTPRSWRLDGKYIVSGHAHPFNQDEPVYGEGPKCRVPLVISSVHMVMSWPVYDDVGPWDEPGGPGGSEDYKLCMRAKDKGYGFAVTDPHCIIHCGLTSSSGKQIVGYDLMMAKNKELVKNLGLEGKVVFG